MRDSKHITVATPESQHPSIPGPQYPRGAALASRQYTYILWPVGAAHSCGIIKKFFFCIWGAFMLQFFSLWEAFLLLFPLCGGLFCAYGGLFGLAPPPTNISARAHVGSLVYLLFFFIDMFTIHVWTSYCI